VVFLSVIVGRRLRGLVIDGFLDQIEARCCFSVFSGRSRDSSSDSSSASSGGTSSNVFFLLWLVHNGELQLDLPLEDACVQDSDKCLGDAVITRAVLVLVAHHPTQGREGLAHDDAVTYDWAVSCAGKRMN
jgi:hypothetical protein